MAQRNIYTVFHGPDVDSILAHRNIIIDSNTTHIEIRAVKEGQTDEGRIVLFENANGVSFNSLHRTHVSWIQEIRQDGSVWYRITVHEPNGVVRRNARLVINLVPDNIPIAQAQMQPFNFILNTGAAPVTFSADPTVDYMFIDQVIVNNAWGIINFPPPPTELIPFVLEVRRLVINSSSTVNIRTLVTDYVQINSNTGNFTFGDIGTAATLGTDVLVSNGTSHTINSAPNSTVRGNVRFETGGGSITLVDVIGNVYVNTNIAGITMRNIDGEVNIETYSSAIRITEISGQLNYESTAGTIVVNNTHGFSDVRTTRANVTIGTTSNASSPVTAGAQGNVVVYNRYGSTTVNFGWHATAHELHVVGFDGNVVATNIKGLVNIMLGSNGRATVQASFLQIANGSLIEHQGSTSPGVNFGNITVTLQRVNAQTQFNQPFSFIVENTRSARDFTGWPVAGSPGNVPSGVEIPNFNAFPSPGAWQVHGGSVNHALVVRTSNTVALRAA